MNQAVINIKLNPIIKVKAQKIAGALGFSLSSLIKAYLIQLIKTKTVLFSADSETPSDYLLEALAESKADIKNENISPGFTNAQDIKAWLKNPKRKYASEIHKKIQQKV